MKRDLSIDIETFSSVNLGEAGVDKYVESEDFEVMLFAYAFDDDPPVCIDLTGLDEWPIEHEEVFWAMTDPSFIKYAYNANFEIKCLGKKWFKDIEPSQWRCTMVMSMMLGLPSGLFATGMALNLDTQKDIAGKDYIRYFCTPCKPTKTNGGRTRNLREHDPLQWDGFVNYCKHDVVQERKVRHKLPTLPLTDTEIMMYALDQKINKRGIEVDLKLARNAIEIGRKFQEVCLEKVRLLTGVDNPKSNKQIKDWLEGSLEIEVESLNKKAMPKLLENINCDVALEVLELRKQFSKTSIKKYDKMLACASIIDNRARGLLQYIGANRTWRWAGRLIQVQNLPRNTMPQIDLAREVAKTGTYDELEILWPNVSEVLSQLIRTAFVAKQGHVLAATDFASIEARVTAWLAGEKWRLDVFSSHGKIYEASASQMFKVPLESVMKGGANYHMRQNGKVAELALGFGGGPNALIAMGALEMQFMKDFIKTLHPKWRELTKGRPSYVVIENGKETIVFKDYEEFEAHMVIKELAKLVRMWRNASPNIVKFWAAMNEAAIDAIQNPGSRVSVGKIHFEVKHKRLYMWLPSGHPLVYLNPRLIPGKFENSVQIVYENLSQHTKKFVTTSTYGGKLAENAIQAIARDLLVEAMLRLDKAGYPIVMHVHDEIVLEIPEARAASDVLHINKLMSINPPWATGLPLSAETTISKYYKKAD